MRSATRKGTGRDPAYRQWILLQPCIMTGKAGSGSEILPTYISGLPPLFKRPWRVTGHHVKNGPGASKDDRRMVPLVDYLHMLTHAMIRRLTSAKGMRVHIVIRGEEIFFWIDANEAAIPVRIPA